MEPGKDQLALSLVSSWPGHRAGWLTRERGRSPSPQMGMCSLEGGMDPGDDNIIQGQDQEASWNSVSFLIC